MLQTFTRLKPLVTRLYLFDVMDKTMKRRCSLKSAAINKLLFEGENIFFYARIYETTQPLTLKSLDSQADRVIKQNERRTFKKL
jgi:hypothetical protein